MSNENKTTSNERGTTVHDGLATQAFGMGAEICSTMADYQREVERFASDRLAKDGEAMRQTLSCRDWTGVFDIQARWVEETLRDYNAEMSKLTGMYAKSTASAVRDEHRRS
jgi:hypothetical protein